MKPRKKTPEQLIRTALARQWYTQAFSGYPLYLTASAWSGMTMARELGYRYERFLFCFKSGYGEMNYLESDLKNMWRTVKQKQGANERYLDEVRASYERTFDAVFTILFESTSGGLARKTDRELVDLFAQSIKTLTDSVGVGHVIEAVSMGVDHELKKQFVKHVGNSREFNEYFLLLTSPTRPSFSALEEASLRSIRNKRGVVRDRAVRDHRKRFSWVRNSYLGARPVTLREIERRLLDDRARPSNVHQVVRRKQNLIRRLGLTQGTIRLLEIIDSATVWQDERKANILRCIELIDKILRQIERRTKVSVNLMRHLTADEAVSLSNFADLSKKAGVLSKRTQIVFFLMSREGTRAVSGASALALERLYARAAAEHEFLHDLHGSVANGGRAIGRVALVREVKYMNKVKDGDVLVTSMTRPEFMPALRKASAIITDEGGITSHAAIISRELNIPAVIGTKNATKLLRDGMIVEVRADHGLVSIIE